MDTKEQKKTIEETSKKGFFKKFPPQFWLVVIFEFFERGSYYGMMSFISVYFTDTLLFPKESVGVIKGVIQPLLYFLPIISGAIADRFGYRKILMVAFALLGGGYFLTSQMTTYTAVFAALVIMGFGAGTFKPIISGTIARITDESNSTQAFGIFYWSINLGAFLFPLVLVPVLKSMDPTYVIIASAICTAAMIIPTAFFFKDPTKQKRIEDAAKKKEQTSLIQTLANAFEIIYSPMVLLFNQMKRSGIIRIVIGLLLILLFVFSIFNFLESPTASEKFSSIGVVKGETTLIFKVDRNMSKQDPYQLTEDEKSPKIIKISIYKPIQIQKSPQALTDDLKQYPGFESISIEEISSFINQSDKKIELIGEVQDLGDTTFKVEKLGENQFKIILNNLDNYNTIKQDLLKEIHTYPILKGISIDNCDNVYKSMETRPFFLLFVISLIIIGLFIIFISSKKVKDQSVNNSGGFQFSMLLIPAVIITIWFLPGLSPLGKIICSIIYLSVMSLFIIDKSDTHKFADHSKFLLMIILYSGFWVLYFQMFDSVLWYVQAYVNAESLNIAINKFLGVFGFHINWFFDVEHVTVINAMTIIILQLVISNIVKKKKALPTMITGIGIGTIGMGILAISTDIWVFLLGIVIFSIGEMTAHPKFISYIGLIAPSDKKAMYMGYLFLYGVFGSSIGGILGAKLYVHFVDNLNQPKILWLIFSSIGIITIICLLLYNKFLAPKDPTKA